MEKLQDYGNLEWQSLPFRDSIHITRGLALVVWHDVNYIECYYQLSTLDRTDDDGKRHYRVLAAFKYQNELAAYLNQLDFVNYL